MKLTSAPLVRTFAPVGRYAIGVGSQWKVDEVD